MQTWLWALAGLSVLCSDNTSADEPPRDKQAALRERAVRGTPRRFLVLAAAAQEKANAAVGGARHPLEPLSATEMTGAVDVVRKGKKLDPSFRFVSCTLDEPSKEAVLGHKPGQDFSRRAFCVLLDNTTGIGYEAVVDLSSSFAVFV